jgi:hypothetical protein
MTNEGRQLLKDTPEPASGGFLSLVPDLTRCADIKLNKRVSLRSRPRSLSITYRTISPDHIPVGGFAL